ncbi:MAG TPA: methenyltetrahydromethanopterin cyclohydrolase, partial [Planctomycetaceae bacterium]|nr:methenyltetrahydromethanopterin cyclohydrolase [Planctomycetaceae bacterium]
MTGTGGLLNDRAWKLAATVRDTIDDLRGTARTLDCGATILDLGIDVPGGLEAGLALARLCLADRGRVSLTTGTQPLAGWPCVEVSTDSPLAACLASQYA